MGVTLVLLLFGTTTLAQPFVIPTSSMEDTLLVGDHLLVDKLAYAPSGPIGKYLLPYEEPKHGARPFRRCRGTFLHPNALGPNISSYPRIPGFRASRSSTSC